MDRMGLWAIQKYGVKSVTTNRSESFNAMVKRFSAWREAPLDSIILYLYRLFESMNTQITRSRYKIGGDYTLRDHLADQYNADIDCPQLTIVRSPEEIFDDLKNSRKHAQAMVRNIYIYLYYIENEYPIVQYIVLFRHCHQHQKKKWN